MQRREFIRSSLAIAAAASVPDIGWSVGTPRSDQTRRILYVFGQLAPTSAQAVVEAIGGSAFNVVNLSFLEASLTGAKLTLRYNRNEFSALAPEVPALLARLRFGFRPRRKVMLSIGGWQHVATFEAIRSFGVSAFVRQLTEQVILPLGFDGIDLDLEPERGGLDQWIAVHQEYGVLLAELTNEYKRVHPGHCVTHAPISSVAAELYVKPAALSCLNRGLLDATRTKHGNNIDWLNVQFYEGGLVAGGNIAGYYRDSLAAPLMHRRDRTGIVHPLHFLTPLFQPEAQQPLSFCRQTIEEINLRCANLHAGSIDGAAIWDYRQVAPSIQNWSLGLEQELCG